MLNRLLVLFAIALTAGAFWANSARAEFPDVPIDHWAYDAVSFLQEEGFAIGYPDGTFGGDRTLTRYEFAMVVSRVYQQFIEMENQSDEDEKPDIEVQAVIDMLMQEFQPELTELRGLIDSNTQRIENLECTVGGMDARFSDLNSRIDAMQPKVSTHGDLTLRFEGNYPNKGLQDQRPRFMFHYGFTTPVNDELTFGAQLASGATDSRQSTFETLGDAFGTDSINIDRAYMQWTPKCAPQFTAWAGKFEPPWKTSPMVWDTDVMVEGLAQKYTADNFNLYLGELVPAVEGYYIVAQAGYNNLFTENNNVAVTYHFINDRAWRHLAADMQAGTLPSKFDFSRLDNPTDYQAIEGYWDWKTSMGDVPVRVQADYLVNLANAAKAVEGEPQRSGWQKAFWARLTLMAAPAQPGDWNVWGEWGRLQPNSVLSWTTDAWRGSGDAQFWAVAWNYKLMRSTDLNISYISADRLSSDASFTDVLVNLTTKFD